MNTQGILRVKRRHTLEVSFEIMTIPVNYDKEPKQLNIIALHVKCTLARPPIYHGAYTKKLSTSSPSIQLSSRSAVYFYCLCNRMKRFWKSRKRLRKPIFLTIFGNESMIKVRSQSKLAVKTHCRRHCLHFWSIQVIWITLRHAERATL